LNKLKTGAMKEREKKRQNKARKPKHRPINNAETTEKWVFS
jgi:hypothetical protein